MIKKSKVVTTTSWASRPAFPLKQQHSPRTEPRDSQLLSQSVETAFIKSTAVSRIFFLLKAGERFSSPCSSNRVLFLFSDFGGMCWTGNGVLFGFGGPGVLGGVGGKPGKEVAFATHLSSQRQKFFGCRGKLAL